MIQGFKNVLRNIRSQYIMGELNASWRKANKHNMTELGRRCRADMISVGRYTYGKINVYDYGADTRLKIGSFCSIGNNVTFMVGGDHDIYRVSTYPFKKIFGDKQPETKSKGDIIIEDDVWIGNDVYIMSGVKIGRGAVIAAGAVVTREVPAFSVVGGVPAKVIKYRFTEEIINILLQLNWNNVTEQEILNKIEELYKSPVNIEDIRKIVKELNHTIN